MCSEVPFTFLAHKAVAIEFLSFPITHENYLSIKQYPLRTRGLSTPASVPSPTQQSATACAIIFSHIFSASADLQLTRNPVPVPRTSSICLRKHVTHSTLSSPSQCPWLHSFKEFNRCPFVYSSYSSELSSYRQAMNQIRKI